MKDEEKILSAEAQLALIRRLVAAVIEAHPNKEAAHDIFMRSVPLMLDQHSAEADQLLKHVEGWQSIFSVNPKKISRIIDLRATYQAL